ncbi:Putative uncharacterized protein [Pararhodospirillum photometricum DSM 122]|uniref:Lipoprotein SmpA/OmlA domain-containing protein n=2 Tax=Pararhodospirillum photometricum TaxID=1084 RepID=H6SN83_PARPM|nr:Putative uncharacterized protein [Pararhodospirillum photometricum DSM 122]
MRMEQFKTLTPDDVVGLLGSPSAVTLRGMATIWEYRGKACTFYISFYPEIPGDKLRVLGVEIDGGIAETLCLNRLRESGRPHGR